jgi:NAD(P)-dependent dehydrogenase (short-subunit alcohol dehydrogenase family)
MQKMKNRVVVITGGSSGFGKAMAHRFYDAGSTVIITGHREQRLRAAQKEIGDVEYVKADATLPDDWERLGSHIHDRYGRIDVLINNAGGGVSIKETVEQSIEDIDRILSLNLTSVVYGCRIFGRVMKKQGEGTIINVSSACANEAWPNFSVYAAAKAGVVSLSKGLYVELRPYNVRVTALVPGAGRTGFSKNAGLPEPASPFKLEGVHLAEAAFHICSLPQSIMIEEYRIWGTDQEVIPL